MVGYSELLLSRVKETGPAKSYAEKIMEASERAAAVIQDMLTLARRGVQTRHALNLNTLIMDFLKTPEYQHIEMVHPEIELRTQLDAKPLHILGSPVQTRQNDLEFGGQCRRSYAERRRYHNQNRQSVSGSTDCRLR